MVPAGYFHCPQVILHIVQVSFISYLCKNIKLVVANQRFEFQFPKTVQCLSMEIPGCKVSLFSQ